MTAILYWIVKNANFHYAMHETNETIVNIRMRRNIIARILNDNGAGNEKSENVVRIIIVRMELKLFRIVDVCLSDYSLNYTDTRVGRSRQHKWKNCMKVMSICRIYYEGKSIK